MVKAGAIYSSHPTDLFFRRNVLTVGGMRAAVLEIPCNAGNFKKKTPVWSNQFDAKFKEKIHACKAHNTYFPQSICYTQSLYTSLNGDAYTTTQTRQTLVSCFTRKISAFTTRPKSTLFSYATSTLQGGVFKLNAYH